MRRTAKIAKDAKRVEPRKTLAIPSHIAGIAGMLLCLSRLLQNPLLRPLEAGRSKGFCKSLKSKDAYSASVAG